MRWLAGASMISAQLIGQSSVTLNGLLNIVDDMLHAWSVFGADHYPISISQFRIEEVEVILINESFSEDADYLRAIAHEVASIPVKVT